MSAGEGKAGATTAEGGALTDETVLIRFSQSDFHHVKRQIRDCRKKAGYYGLSLFGSPHKTVDEVCRIVRFANNWMRLVTVGKLRKAGFDPRQRGADPLHVALKWKGMPSDAEIGRFVDSLGEIQENPYPAGIGAEEKRKR